MMSMLDDAVAGTRLFTSTVRLLRTPVDAEAARVRLRERIEHRTDNFLELARTSIFPLAESPYRRLLDHAGGELGDVERLVEGDGLEGALQELYRRGVYLTVDEFKGRAAVTRGSMSFTVDSKHLHNPRVSGDMVAQTSGSRGRRTSVPMELGAVQDNAYFDLDGSIGCVHARWSVPGSGSLRWMVGVAVRGTAPERWFSPVDPKMAGLHPRYALSARVVRWAGLLAGARLPGPEYVPLSDPSAIVDWMAGVLRTGRTPRLRTYVTLAVRVCQAAADAGVELRGAQFDVSGEPATAARLRAIQAVGATAITRYGNTEASGLGRGCLSPEEPDEVHFRHDRLGLVQPGADARPGLPPQALLVTSLAPRARLLLLNVCVGDQAVVTQRDCRCPLQGAGWTTHLHSIRSFEKLTAAGMTFFDADVAHALEVALPARFGGRSTDYQIVEEETASGLPGMRLLVHPRLGPLDAEEVRQAFLDAIGGGSEVERVMGHVWHDAKLPIVDRTPPHSTRTGKTQHVHHATGS